MNTIAIMIVEDEKDHFDLMRQAIEKEFPDATVRLYENADSCLEAIEKSIPDIIVADYVLPGMNGLELFEELKRHKIETPVVLVSAHGDEDIAVKAMKLGAFDYVVKSSRFFELLPEIIRKALRDKELKEKVQQAQEKEIRLLAQLQRAQKMETIGTLAGGIAHDFNNLLMGIQGRISLMSLDIDSKHPHFEHLRGIEEMIKKGADLTRRLLGFAMGGKYEVRSTNINKFAQKSSEIFVRTNKDIIIHRNFQEGVWRVEIDRGQIDLLLLNLYINAQEAMSETGKGEIYLETKNVMIDKTYSRPYNVKEGPFVRISVTDNGVGMDEATRERIFEPFFTTKKMGGGTGLGLASAFGVIKNHGGIINAYSEKGKGTTFNIYLPATEKEVAKEMDASYGQLKGGATVLLVDDEDMVIDVGEEMLKAMGYEVLTAKGGVEAIKTYEENEDRIDIVILDMIMPDMDGGKVFDMMREINPDTKVILSSGYSINGQATEILDRGCNSFIQKPYTLKDVSQKLREVLDP